MRVEIRCNVCAARAVMAEHRYRDFAIHRRNVPWNVAHGNVRRPFQTRCLNFKGFPDIE